MPEKKTLERAKKDKAEGKAPSTQAGEFVREEMDHIREGKHGARSTKQAIAIGLSKARRAGVKLKPPAKGKSPELALHFRRGDVAGQLARPLRTTLPALVPTPDTIDQSPEKPFVESLTFGNLFKFSLTQANQDASVFLVLDPVPAQS